MSAYRFLISLVGGLLPVFAVFGADPPNIILIFSDDHGYCDLGAQGIRDDVKTPHLDRLVAGGVRFTNGYVTAPQCVPSRAGLLTGRYQNRFAVESNRDPLDGFNAQLTLAERLKKKGYATGMTGKWHLGDSRQIIRHGFDDVYYKNSNRPGWSNFDLQGNDRAAGPEDSGLYHLDANSSAACAFIKRHHQEPFFFYCAYRAPHVPLDAPPKYLARFPGPMPERRRQALAMISAMDDGVGRIMKTLRDYGIEERTLVFFIGDNGAPLKIHKIDAPGGGPGWDGSLNEPLNGEKGMLSEGGIRVPFVASWKGVIQPGTVCDSPVLSLDVAATAAQLAGLGKVAELDGIHLIPHLVKDPESMPQRKLFWRWVAQSAVREGNWKFLKGGQREYLFDLSIDPEEKKNLIEEHPSIAARLKKELVHWSAKLSPPGIEEQKLAGSWQRYFAHYLDGKRESRPAEPSRLSPERKSNLQGWIARGGKLKQRDGFLVFQPDRPPKSSPFLVRNGLRIPSTSTVIVQFLSSSASPLGVAWRSEDQKDFRPEQVIRRTAASGKGIQSIRLPMKSGKTIVHIRLLLGDPLVKIRSIQVVDGQDRPVQRWDFGEKAVQPKGAR